MEFELIWWHKRRTAPLLCAMPSFLYLCLSFCSLISKLMAPEEESHQYILWNLSMDAIMCPCQPIAWSCERDRESSWSVNTRRYETHETRRYETMKSLRIMGSRINQHIGTMCAELVFFIAYMSLCLIINILICLILKLFFSPWVNIASVCLSSECMLIHSWIIHSSTLLLLSIISIPFMSLHYKEYMYVDPFLAHQLLTFSSYYQ